MTRGRAAVVVLTLALLVVALDAGVLIDRGTSDGTTGSAPAPSPSASTAPPSETVAEQIARVARTVARIRELRFDATPDPTYLRPEELDDRVEQLTADYTVEEADTDVALYAALRALPRDYDLRAALTTALSEQVIGFYDPETEELVVSTGAPGRRLGPFDELTLSHELEHALADQALGLPSLEADEGQEDAAVARQALVEGDATLAMQDYLLQAFSLLDQIRLGFEAGSAQAQLGDYEQLPYVLRRSLEFPYVEGLAFVSTLRQQGGWAAVDRAYQDPPVSTAQILFPDRYLAGEQPAPLGPPGQAPPPWEPQATYALGAADLLFLFEAPGDDPRRALADPRGAASAWAAGTATVWADTERTAVGLALADREGGRLCEAIGTWYERTSTQDRPVEPVGDEVLALDGPDQDASLRCAGGEVRLGLAPDLETARTLSG